MFLDDLDNLDDVEPQPDVSTVQGVIDELERQAALLTSVATGGPRIDDKLWEYQDRRRRATSSGGRTSPMGPSMLSMAG